MSRFVGIVNLKENISDEIHILEEMNNEFIHIDTNEQNILINEHGLFGHNRLNNLTEEQLVKKENYIINFDGNIYNLTEFKEALESVGYFFNSNSIAEILIAGYIHHGYKIVNKLNGIFAFSIFDLSKQELFLCRDHFGVKPLFYTIANNNFIFASEIKAILAHPCVERKLNSTGISELFGLGPGRTSGIGVFYNIYELKPANYMVYNSYGIITKEYWKLESKEHTDDFETTCDKVRYLLNDSIKIQSISDSPICSFLSGGLDSSIITSLMSNSIPNLNTFSVDYIDNDKNFVKSDFQPNSDKHYIDIVKNKFNTTHETIFIDTPELSNYLEDAMIARDLPGMADVDSSLLVFCKSVKSKFNVALSGECADEIFGGYPWLFKKDALSLGTFPWSLALNERQNILNEDISNKINLKEYVDFRFSETLKNVPKLHSDSKEDAEKRNIFYLNLYWFMQTLIDRSDRMSAYCNFEIRVPFCDYRLIEYVWNIPWDMKALHGREKGLLRYIVKDILPEEIIDRKKSPFPKTHNPTYLNKVKTMLQEIIDDNNSPILNLLNKKYIQEILDTNASNFTQPWYGQLMTGPQFMAYLIQVNMWLKKYNPKIEL